MLFFDHQGRRSRLRPASLAGKEIESAKRQVENWLQLDPRRREQSDVPPVWKIAFEADVISALSQLSDGRCAFCEEKRMDLMPYRFRPPGYAEPPLEPARKGSYVWLAFNWSNLFPICPDCRPRLANRFPVRGQTRSVPVSPFDKKAIVSKGEEPVLLFPGELARPHEFGIARADGGIAAHDRANATIDNFRLNRADLMERRRGAWQDLMQSVENRQSLSAKLVLEDQLLSTFPRGDHGWFLFLFCHRLVQILPAPAGERETVADSVEAVAKRLAKFAARKDFVEPLRAALARMAAEDSGDKEIASVSFTPEAGDLITSPPRAHTTSRIKSVALKNFKSLEDIAFTLPEKLELAQIDKGPTEMRPPEAPCLMLLGENATGKSSILEAIVLACAPQETVGQLRKMGKLEPKRLQLNPRYMGQVDGSVPSGETSIRVEFHEGPARTCRIAESQLTRQPQADEAPPLLFAFGAHRLAGSGEHSPLLRVATLFDNHTPLADPEEWLRQLDPPALNEVCSALRYIIQIDGEFEYIDFVEDVDGERVCMLHFWRPDGTAPEGRRQLSQPLRMMSSGYRAVLALVVEILRGLAEANPNMAPHDARMSRATVLVDEIEAHLHPRWKLHIMTGLRRALPNVTFIVTSHDPLCVRGMFNGEVMALNRYENVQRDGRELPERVERVKDFENVEVMTVDQLLTSPMFGLFSAESESLNRRLAAASDILSQRHDGREPTAEDKAILEHLDRSIAAGLPFGQDMINDIVREAVLQYLKARRDSSTAEASKKRQAAVVAVRNFLNELVP